MALVGIQRVAFGQNDRMKRDGALRYSPLGRFGGLLRASGYLRKPILTCIIAKGNLCRTTPSTHAAQFYAH